MTIEQYEAPTREVEAPRHAGALALDADQTDWTSAQEAALVQLGIADAPKADQQVFMHVAQRSGLDPFARQIYLIGRNDKTAPGGKKWTIQTGIDGFRVMAERRLEYMGQTAPQWCDSNGKWSEVWLSKTPPAAARVGVYRSDREHITWAIAHFWEFAQTKFDGDLNAMWKTKPANQIAKCAEAAALRKAFPQDFSGLYISEEMEAGQVSGGGRAPVRARAQRTAVSASDLTGDTTASQHRDQGAIEQTAEPITRGQSKQIGDLFTEAGVPRADRLAVVNQLAPRKVEKPSELTVEEAEALIGRMTEIGPEGLCRAAGIEVAEEEPPAENVGDAEAEWAAQVGGDQ